MEKPANTNLKRYSFITTLLSLGLLAGGKRGEGKGGGGTE
jgi:hypothetical protein